MRRKSMRRIESCLPMRRETVGDTSRPGGPPPRTIGTRLSVARPSVAVAHPTTVSHCRGHRPAAAKALRREMRQVRTRRSAQLRCLALSCLDGSRESPLNPASDGAPHAAKSSALWGAHVAYATGLLRRGVDRAATARVVSLKHLQAQVRMMPPRRRTRAVTAGEPGHLHARRVARVSGTCPQLAKVIQLKPST